MNLLDVVMLSSSLIGLGVNAIVDMINKSDESTTISGLKEQSLRVEIKANASLFQAKAEQYLAI